MADPRNKKLQVQATKSTTFYDTIATGSVGSPIASELAQTKSARQRLMEAEFPKPAHTRIMAVTNQKGGVGKTTTAVNIAAALAKHGLNVMVIDSDPQGNASTALGIEHHSEIASVYDVLLGDMSIREVVQQSAEGPMLSVVPATIELSGAEIELVGVENRESKLEAPLDEYLRTATEHDEPRLDYVLIDCPPSLGLLTINAMVAANEVLIPIQSEYYALEGLSQLLNNVQLVKNSYNNILEISTILLTMFDRRTNLANEVAQDVREHFPETTLNTKIPRSVRISEAPSFEQTVITYDPSSPGAIAYEQAALEIAKQGGK
ncbi:ParA family protein [Flaviflexus huanghaiensis]|uniref:ParA family protein n=1 Tax=Flaviflexus huanghaiensis TaxID=1111473 RepID=UPI00240F22B5|nr:ParA family protein [Flaviflexus huanghaiensis]